MDSRDNSRLLGMISMSKRAGKLTAGFDTVAEGVRAGSISCVFFASDISPKTLKEINYVCKQENARLIPLPVTMDDIGRLTAKRAGIIAVNDAGLRRKISELALEEPAQEEQALNDGGKI